MILNVGKAPFWIKPLMQSTLIVPIDLTKHYSIFKLFQYYTFSVILPLILDDTLSLGHF